METVDLEELVRWTNSPSGGMIAGFSPANFKIISYFLTEFSVKTIHPDDEISAFRMGKLIVVGRRWFLADVKAGLGLPD